ncbi:O-antigen ligase family protein [Lactobacillus hominis]|uniref:O-antigen ligase family protein n=1 Tax=Lactobacillus hominis TaxID=1203033 RepID=UPI0023F2B916|nr:O-antigen ligase family protein [Lactobacillus hominis]
MLQVRKNSFFEKLTDILLALFLILNCQSMYQNSYNVNYHIYEITLFLIITSMIIKFLKYPIDLLEINKLSVFSLLYFIVAVITLVVSVSSTDFLSFSARFLIAPFILLYFVPICDTKNKIQLLLYFVKWVCIITVVSIFFYVMGTTMNLIHPTGTFIYKWGNVNIAQSFYNIYFGNVQYTSGGILKGLDFRNTAIFVEGPMYAAVLDLALYFLFVFKTYFKNFKICLVILWLGIITSNSTAAILIGILVVFLFIKNSTAFKKVQKIIIIPVAILLIWLIFDLLNKKMGNFNQTSSFGIRLDDYIAGFRAWLARPMFGWGYNNLSGINIYRNNLSNGGYSNSILAILNAGGLVFGSLYFIPIIYALFSKINKQIELALLYFFLLALILFYTSYINFFIWALLIDRKFWLELKKKSTKRN